MAAPTPVACPAPFTAAEIQRVPPTALANNTTTNLIAAVVGKTITVLGYKVQAGPTTDTNYTFKDTAATAVVPTVPMVAGTKDAGPFNPYGLWSVPADLGLDMLLSNGAAGVLEYLYFVQR